MYDQSEAIPQYLTKRIKKIMLNIFFNLQFDDNCGYIISVDKKERRY